MADPLRMDLTADEAAKMDTAIRECMAAMQRANEQMARDQAQIDRLKAETRAILAQLEAA